MSLRGLRGSGDRSRPLTSGLPRLDGSHKRLPAPRVMQSPRPGWCFGDECAFNPACQPDRCMVKKERQQARSATAHSPHLLKVEDRWMQKERGQQMVSQKWHSAQLLKVKRDEAPAGDSSRDQAHGGLKDAGISDRFRKVPRLGRCRNPPVRREQKPAIWTMFRVSRLPRALLQEISTIVQIKSCRWLGVGTARRGPFRNPPLLQERHRVPFLVCRVRPLRCA